MSVCIIFNPTARGEKARRMLRQLQALGGQCVLKPTATAGSAEALAAQAVEEGCETIVAAGGDGTVNEVVNGIGAKSENFDRVRLGVLPVGSANAFARELGIPSDLPSAWSIVLQGEERRIDLPEAEFVRSGVAGAGRRYFVQLAGAGFDAEALTLIRWEWKKRNAWAAYIAAGLGAMLRPRCSITARTAGKEACGHLVIFGNGRLYGGSIMLFPEARLDDGLLHVCVFPRVNWLVLARYGFGLLSSRLLSRRGEIFLHGSEVTLESKEKTLFQVDGDLVGELPARLSVWPRRLRVMAPR